MTVPATTHAATVPDPTSPFIRAEAIVDLREELAGAAASREQQLHALSLAGKDPVVAAQREGLVQTIAEIRSALQRLDEGTFGRCTSCSDPVPLERLEFRPWAATCVACARR